jgi:hypothetical protein
VLVGLAFSSAQLARATGGGRAWLWPLALAAVAAAALAWPSAGLNDAKVKGSALVGAVGVFAAAWNVWHTLMQKFGILRVYAAKSQAAVERRTPAWVDRLLVFSWFPLLALYLGPAQREEIGKHYKSVTQFLVPVIDVLAAVQPVLLPPAVLLVLFALVAFVHYERRSGVVSVPRISMAVALFALNSCFFFVAPLKVYIAYGFSHALEYMVFVWAFLRRRYQGPLPHRPLLQRVLQHPVLAYGAFMLAIGGAFFVIEYGDNFQWHKGGIRLFDVKLSSWLFSFAIWHSMVHFYFDGFLWKMRAPAVRASL